MNTKRFSTLLTLLTLATMAFGQPPDDFPKPEPADAPKAGVPKADDTPPLGGLPEAPDGPRLRADDPAAPKGDALPAVIEVKPRPSGADVNIKLAPIIIDQRPIPPVKVEVELKQPQPPPVPKAYTFLTGRRLAADWLVEGGSLCNPTWPVGSKVPDEFTLVGGQPIPLLPFDRVPTVATRINGIIIVTKSTLPAGLIADGGALSAFKDPSYEALPEAPIMGLPDRTPFPAATRKIGLPPQESLKQLEATGTRLDGLDQSVDAMRLLLFGPAGHPEQGISQRLEALENVKTGLAAQVEDGKKALGTEADRLMTLIKATKGQTGDKGPEGDKGADGQPGAPGPYWQYGHVRDPLTGCLRPVRKLSNESTWMWNDE